MKRRYFRLVSGSRHFGRRREGGGNIFDHIASVVAALVVLCTPRFHVNVDFSDAASDGIFFHFHHGSANMLALPCFS